MEKKEEERNAGDAAEQTPEKEDGTAQTEDEALQDVSKKVPKTNWKMTTDGRKLYEWKTKYPNKALRAMRWEAAYLSALFIIAITLMLMNFLGVFVNLLGIEDLQRSIFTYITYFTVAGLLGGCIFGLKCLSYVVTKGFWHEDRAHWRILSPLISTGTALIVGSMACAGIVSAENSLSNTWAVAFGFFSGYFADDAVAKMYEVTSIIFGRAKKE